jgi:hypothetical protein
VAFIRDAGTSPDVRSDLRYPWLGRATAVRSEFTVPADNSTTERQIGTARVKRGMAEMLKGGVIMDVVTPEQARIAENAGAVAVMALERVPADIRAQGGVARMSDPDMIASIMDAVSIQGSNRPLCRGAGLAGERR